MILKSNSPKHRLITETQIVVETNFSKNDAIIFKLRICTVLIILLCFNTARTKIQRDSNQIKRKMKENRSNNSTSDTWPRFCKKKNPTQCSVCSCRKWETASDFKRILPLTSQISVADKPKNYLSMMLPKPLVSLFSSSS